jgi:hypothetical protein
LQQGNALQQAKNAQKDHQQENEGQGNSAMACPGGENSNQKAQQAAKDDNYPRRVMNASHESGRSYSKKSHHMRQKAMDGFRAHDDMPPRALLETAHSVRSRTMMMSPGKI